jgi:hypothetical protein
MAHGGMERLVFGLLEDMNRQRGTVLIDQKVRQSGLRKTLMLIRRAMLQNEVIPGILDKWPVNNWHNTPGIKIRIQQDGAGAHINPQDEVLEEFLGEIGLDGKVELFNQPANSPDLNVNDLGFFAALEKAYFRERPKNYTDIIACVQKTFWAYPKEKMNRLWLTKMQVMDLIVQSNGDNDFQLPHMGKAKLERQNKLPTTLEVSAHVRAMLE